MPVTAARARVKAWLEAVGAARERGEAAVQALGPISAAALAGICEGIVKEGEAAGRANRQAITQLMEDTNKLGSAEVFRRC